MPDPSQGTAPWPTVRPQVGPVPAGPGTLRSTYQQMKADPNVRALAAGVQANHPEDEMFRSTRVAAGSVRAGYQHGQQQAQAAYPAAAPQEGSGWSSNGDGGSEMATAEDVAGLHEHIDAVHQSVSGMANSAVPPPSANMQQTDAKPHARSPGLGQPPGPVGRRT